MDDEIRDQYNEIKSFLEKEGFNIFYEVIKPREDVHVWDTKYDWKKFFEIAKKEDVKTIIVSSIDFTLQDVSDELEKEKIDLIKKYNGKMELFVFMWYKDLKSFWFSKTADWHDEVSSIIPQEDEEVFGESREELQEKITNLQKLSLEELTKEVREYAKAEELLSAGTHVIEQRFLQSKDIFGHHFADQIPKLNSAILKLEQEELARQKQALPELVKKFTKFLIETSYGRPPNQMLSQFLVGEGIRLDFELRSKLLATVEGTLRELARKEKEEMPKLFYKAVEWARENKKSRFTKSDLEAFLSETETRLSKANADMLYSKVNTELKK
jgi:hypothetical protein